MPAPLLNAPQHHGAYRVDSLLHRDEGSETYLVQRTADHTWWALKVLTDTDRRHVERLQREALVRDGLRHPHIVPATEVLTISGHAALVMDFVEGPSLETWLQTHRPSPAEALQLFAGIVQAVSHAHEHGVIHRDLRPGTVLLAPAGPGLFMARVADWGLAKIRASEVGTFGGITTVQRGLGVPGYAAPEQIRDASSASAPADVFSLGCILYELLTGRGPFAGRSTMDAAMAARSESFERLDVVSPNLEQQVMHLVHWMLKADPGQRPADAYVVWEALAELPPFPTSAERPWWWWPAVATVPLVVAAAVGVLATAG